MHTENNAMLTVNGAPYPYAAGTTAAALLQAVHTGPGVVVMEVNGEIVPRERFAETFLHAGDRIEIVHFVGGG